MYRIIMEIVHSNYKVDRRVMCYADGIEMAIDALNMIELGVMGGYDLYRYTSNHSWINKYIGEINNIPSEYIFFIEKPVTTQNEYLEKTLELVMDVPDTINKNKQCCDGC